MMRNPDRLRLALAATLLLAVAAAVGMAVLVFWPTSGGPSASGSPGHNASPSPSASLGFVPTSAPTAGATTIVVINQLATQVPSAVPSGAPITVAIFVTVVPGADLIGGSLSFAFTPDGSNAEIAPRSGTGPGGPTLDPFSHAAQNFWVSFLVPSDIVGGTFTARLPVGTEVLHQHSAWGTP